MSARWHLWLGFGGLASASAAVLAGAAWQALAGSARAGALHRQLAEQFGAGQEVALIEGAS